MKPILFKPWKGKNYRSGKGKYGRLLLCGESHYESGDDADATINEIKRFLSPGETGKFWTKIGKIFDPDNPKSIWPEVAFANLVQRSMEDPTDRPSDKDFATVGPAFKRLLHDLKPARVIIFSKSVWEHLPPEDKKMKPMNVDGLQGERCGYLLPSGLCQVLCIHHATRMSNKYGLLIKRFLAKTR